LDQSFELAVKMACMADNRKT